MAGRRPVRDVWVSEGLGPSPVVDEIVERARRLGVPVRTVARARLEATAHTEAPQGVLAHAAALPVADLDELCQPARGGPNPFLLVFDGITDPHNLGGLLRTAACSGVTGAVLPRHRAVHVTPTVAKVAAGGIEHVPMALAPGVPSALASLRRSGVWVVGLAPDGAGSVFDMPLATEPLALVLGAESGGLSRLARERCDRVVSIPCREPGSLNVAAAGAVACYEVVRRRQLPARKMPDSS